MSNSNLIDYINLSPNYNSRTGSINKITIHHMAGNLSVETCGNIFSNPDREASSNYGIGTDGRIAMYVEESNRAWTSSSWENDNQAVTIEVANDGGDPDWHVSDEAMESLINLCVDICERNGITSLNYTGYSDGNLTRHNMFAATACPGPYLQSKFPEIADEVNKRLNGEEPVAPVEPSEPVVTEDAEIYLCVNIGGNENFLDEVRGADADINNEATGYAGISGRTVEGVCVRLENAGFSVVYGVHTLDGETLPDVNSNDADINDEVNGFAGIIGKEIDGIKMEIVGSDEYDIEYQVILKNGTILPPVLGCNANWNDDIHGYAGIFGRTISGIMAKLVRK